MVTAITQGVQKLMAILFNEYGHCRIPTDMQLDNSPIQRRTLAQGQGSLATALLEGIDQGPLASPGSSDPAPSWFQWARMRRAKSFTWPVPASTTSFLLTPLVLSHFTSRGHDNHTKSPAIARYL